MPKDSERLHQAWQLKAKALESEIAHSRASKSEKTNMQHTLLKLCQFMADEIECVRHETKKEFSSPIDPKARDMAEQALRALGKEDLLYAYHGVVHARPPQAYNRLAEFFERYNAARAREVAKKTEEETRGSQDDCG